jgi:hypothetical protein
MKRIWKYAFDATDSFELTMPKGALVLSVQVQRDTPCLWALVDYTTETEVRRFRIAGTGHPIDFDGKFIGTFQLDHGSLVFHLFEVPGQ